MKDLVQILFSVSPLFALGAVLVKVVTDFVRVRDAGKAVLEAEKRAFRTTSTAEEPVAKRVDDDYTELVATLDVKDVSKLLRMQTAQFGNLSDLYGKQIEKYQLDTQSRASWSFIFAIVAMVTGLAFVLAGGMYVISAPDWPHVAAGTAISAIAGAVSAFISKTFLDVHRLSLLQLNQYFRQPVLNAHILTAQRIADSIEEKTVRQACYEKILVRVITLISEHVEDVISHSDDGGLPTKRASERRTKAKDALAADKNRSGS